MRRLRPYSRGMPGRRCGKSLELSRVCAEGRNRWDRGNDWKTCKTPRGSIDAVRILCQFFERNSWNYDFTLINNDWNYEF